MGYDINNHHMSIDLFIFLSKLGNQYGENMLNVLMETLIYRN